ncbi:hypothetical protein ROA7450_03811 [Roseovarius albus]|uniref:Uncharacterized protein n=1 Tax=Roseovarius albus TaxID=1247867 RepID=A0A1X7A6G1_9RHOB|nr:hypothetical protein ROA7450_03811 [Roseovarius albus]
MRMFECLFAGIYYANTKPHFVTAVCGSLVIDK